MRAIIEWATEGEGGRRHPPLGSGSPPYAAIVRFMDTDDPWPPSSVWDLVVSKIKELDNPYKWISDVHFLVDEAPHEMLVVGRQFELYEGKKCVARGELIRAEKSRKREWH